MNTKRPELAHLARILRDMITFPFLVAFAASDALTLDARKVADARQSVEGLLFDLRRLGHTFFDSLDDAQLSAATEHRLCGRRLRGQLLDAKETS